MNSSSASAFLGLDASGNGSSVRCIQGDISIPDLTTDDVSSINSGSATCGGNIISDGGSQIDSRGVCWSTIPGPTISDTKTTDGSNIGNYSSVINGLSSNTIYYVRAYATNSVGTAYGNEVIFTTLTETIISYINRFRRWHVLVQPVQSDQL